MSRLRPVRAATIRDGEVLVEEHPDPEPGAGEVLVRVRAAGLNGADMLQRRGRVAALALELVGAVEAGAANADEHLAGSGLGIEVLLDENLAVADRGGTHGCGV